MSKNLNCKTVCILTPFRDGFKSLLTWLPIVRNRKLTIFHMEMDEQFLNSGLKSCLLNDKKFAPNDGGKSCSLIFIV